MNRLHVEVTQTEGGFSASVQSGPDRRRGEDFGHAEEEEKNEGAEQSTQRHEDGAVDSSPAGNFSLR